MIENSILLNNSMLQHRGQIKSIFARVEAEEKIMHVNTKLCCSMKTNFKSLAKTTSLIFHLVQIFFFSLDDHISHSFVRIYKFITTANKWALWVEMIAQFLHSLRSRDEL